VRRITRGLAALAILAASLTSCGGGEPLPDGPRTVILITVDDLRADRLAPYGYAEQTAPTIARLAVEGTVHPDPIAPSTSRNASLASILTGLAPPEHALSMSTVGRQRLAQRFETLAETYAEAGFRTIAAVSMRQLTPRLSGFDQGFDLYLADDLPSNGSALAPGELVGRVVPELQQLTRRDRVFLWLHLGHLRADPEQLTVDEDGLVRARLRPFAGANPELLRELDSLDFTQGLVPRIEGVIGRLRGSPAWRALHEALYDVQVGRLDAALAALVAELDRSGRYDDAVIALVGTRGRYLTEPRPDGLVEGFSIGVVRVPLILRAPEPGPALEGPQGVAVVAPLLRSVLDPAVEPPAAASARVYRLQAGEWSVADVQAEFKLIGKAGGEAIWFRRLDDAVVGMQTTFETAAGGSLPDSSSELVRLSSADALVPPTVPLLADRAAEAWDVPAEGEAPGWIVDVSLDGTWWNITVADPERTAEVHVYAAVDLASEDASPLEMRLESAGERLSDPALPDAVVLAGTLPFTASIRARPRARLGLNVTIDGATVPAARMRYLGRRFAGARLTYYVPPWLPERPDWFSTLEAGPTEIWTTEPWAAITKKRGTGVYLMEGPIDLTPEEIRFLGLMDRRE